LALNTAVTLRAVSVVRRLPSLITALVAALAVGGLTAGPAGSVIPPRDCGRMSADGARYQVKVDGITCRTGKRYADAYLERNSRPRGYRCRDYASRTGRVRFYCNAGRKVFFAIRR
jgi:hypothetical protein